jgi:hypothetical protein
MFLDVAPLEFSELAYGYPLPIFDSYYEWWGNGSSPVYSTTYVFAGALLDILFYAIVLWLIFGVVGLTKRVLSKKA